MRPTYHPATTRRAVKLNDKDDGVGIICSGTAGVKGYKLHVESARTSELFSLEIRSLANSWALSAGRGEWLYWSALRRLRWNVVLGTM